MKRDRGVWHHGGYDWHVFSYDHTYALSGQEARQAYRAKAVTRLLVLPNEAEGLACRVKSKVPSPALDGEQDVYVVPPDFGWTMVYTHEDGWFGPYFCSAEWVDAPPPPEPKPAPQGKPRKRGAAASDGRRERRAAWPRTAF